MVRWSKKIIWVLAVLLIFGIFASATLWRAAGYSLVGGGVSWVAENFYAIVAQKSTRRLNELLSQENHELKAALSTLELAKYENEMLRQLLKLEEDTEREYTYARTILGPDTNLSSDFAINVGSEDGVAKGMPVLWGSNIFLGTIDKAYRKHSVVRTIFRSDVKIPVQFGAQLISSLLVGGTNPSLDLIPKEELIQVGDPVFIGVGYGNVPEDLYVGEVLEVTTSESDVFQNATVRVPYQVHRLKDVFVIMN